MQPQTPYSGMEIGRKLKTINDDTGQQQKVLIIENKLHCKKGDVFCYFSGVTKRNEHLMNSYDAMFFSHGFISVTESVGG